MTYGQGYGWASGQGNVFLRQGRGSGRGVAADKGHAIGGGFGDGTGLGESRDIYEENDE
jgi:hypothetical protein